MKTRNLLPLLLLFIFFTACVETIKRPIHQDTIAPEFSVDKETLKSRVSAVIPAERINFSSGKTKKTGEPEFNTLIVDIVPDTLPNGISFYRLTDEIQVAVESGIANLEDYQKMEIVVRRTVMENGVEHKQSYKKEIEL